MVLAKEFLSVFLLLIPVALLGWQPLGWEPLALLILSGLLGIALGDVFFFAALRDLSPLALVLLSTAGTGDDGRACRRAPHGHAHANHGCSLGAGDLRRGDCSLRKSLLRQAIVGPEGHLLRDALRHLQSIATLVAKQAFVDVPSADEASLGLTLQATFIRTLAGAAGVLVLGLATGRLSGWIMPFKDRRLAVVFFVAVLRCYLWRVLALVWWP